MVARRSEIYWVALDLTIGTEIQKTRRCVVVSPDELNAHLDRVIVAPVTSTIRPFRFRVTATVDGRAASVMLDQLRTVMPLVLESAWKSRCAHDGGHPQYASGDVCSVILNR